MLAIVTAVDAVILGGVIGPIAADPAWRCCCRPVLGGCRDAPASGWRCCLSLPLAVSALLVNVFFFPGGQDVLLQIGPITATA